MLFYLSGGMEYKDGLGKGWRDSLTKALESMGHGAEDPVKEELADQEAASYNWSKEKLSEDVTMFKHMVRLKMFRKDMLAIKRSDAVVLLYDEAVRRGAGTLAEAWEAFREGKPLYIVTSFERKEIPGWLIGESSEMFSSTQDLLKYLENHEKLEEDVQEARAASKYYLGGIY